MRTFRFLYLGLSVFTAAGLVSVRGAAQDDGQLETAAAELVQRGIALRRSGGDEEALRLFLDAERQAPDSVRVLLHVTAAAQATGRWLMAHEYLQKAAAFRSDPYYQRYRASIKNIEDAVAQHVGQLRVLGSPQGAEVLMNGESVGKLPMSSAQVVEVGSYVLEVKKPGYYALKRPINVTAGGTLIQEAVELKKQEPSTTLGAEAGAGWEQRSGRAGASEQSGNGSSWVTWTLAGTGLALAATSGTAFFLREREAEHWNDDSRCLQGTLTREQVCGDVRNRANSAETVGLVTGALAVGFGGAALLHWVFTSDSKPSRKESAAVQPSCDVGLGTVLCKGSF